MLEGPANFNSGSLNQFYMARLDRPQTTSSNPAKKFLKWNTKKKCFTYWDKDGEKDIDVELPLKFLFLEHYHSVRGWHGATDKGIVSNEVYALGKEELTVRTFGGIELGKGLYRDIKDSVKLAGGVYHRSVYIMLEDGTMANLQLKGAVIGGVKKDQAVKKIDIDGYSEFYNKNNRLLDNQWIEVNSAEDAKKGATLYSVPVFTLGSTITSDDDANANACAKVLQEYVKEYTGQKTAPEGIEVREPEMAGGDKDDLDF
jgi:hypothetical protein